MYQNAETDNDNRLAGTAALHAEIDRLKAAYAMAKDDAQAHWNQVLALQGELKRLGGLLHDLAGVLGVKPVFDAIEEEPILAAGRCLMVKAAKDERLGQVLELIRAAHTTILMRSAPKAKANLGEATRLLAALIDGRA